MHHQPQTPAQHDPRVDARAGSELGDVQSDGRGEVRIELCSKTSYLCSVRAFMQSFCPRIGFDGAQSSQIVLAVDEALANVMKHGYQGRDDGRIVLRVTPFQDSAAHRGPGVRIVIEDEARQVELSQIKSRNLDDVRPGGLGVHIIQRVMDEARYEHREGGVGMRLTLVKHVASPAARGDTLGLDGQGLDVPGIKHECDEKESGGASP